MTMTEPDRDTRDTARDTDLSDEDARLLARAAWHESGGTLTGKQLAERFDRSAKWGQNQAAAARAEAAERAAPAGGAVPRHEPAAPPAVPSPRPAARQPAPERRTAERPEPAAKRTTTARCKPQATPPLPLLVLTYAAVGTVAAVCAVVSYVHIRDLAVTAGMGSLSGWLPLGIDGLAVACTCSLIADRRQGIDGHALAKAGLMLGLAGSLLANVLAVDPELVPLRAVRWGLAGYPPLALAVSAHMLFRMGER